MTKEQEERFKSLTSALVRAARQMRDVTANMGGADDEYGEAWRRLNMALNERDDFLADQL